MSKYVHENPDNSKAWIELCLCLKRAEKYDLALNIGHTVLIINKECDLVSNRNNILDQSYFLYI